MDLIEVKKNIFINRNHITSIVLISANHAPDQIYWWRFALVDEWSVNSKIFTSEQEARKWLKRKIFKEGVQSVFIWDED